MPTASPEDPLFIVAPSLGNVPIGDRLLYATNRIKQTAETTAVVVTDTKEVTVSGLPGYQMTANAADKGSKKPLRVHQTMLFPESGGYVLMVGLVGEKLADEYLPRFAASASTFVP